MREATRWYEAESAEAAAGFLLAVQDCLDAIQEAPGRYPLTDERVRHARVRGFPYSVLFIVEFTKIKVVSVWHHRRDPAEWRKRVRK